MTVRHLSDTEIGMNKVPLLANALQRNEVFEIVEIHPNRVFSHVDSQNTLFAV